MAEPIGYSRPMPTPDAAAGGDKFDRIYARYSQVVDNIAMEVKDDAATLDLMTQNINEISPSPPDVNEISPPPPEMSSPPLADLMGPQERSSHAEDTVPRRLDPPRALDPPEERLPLSTKMTPQKVAISQHFLPPLIQGEILPHVASRDDDATSFSGRHSIQGGASVGSYNYRSHPSGAREDMYSKLDALNAKSRALRGMTYTSSKYAAPLPPRPTSYASPVLSSSASVLSNSSYSPASVMSVPKYSTTTSAFDDNIDSRLEYLTKQSMAMRKHMGVPNPPEQGPKKVTFEADYVQGSPVSGSGVDDKSVYSMDERSVYSGKFAEDTKKSFVSQFNEKVPSVASTSSFASGNTNTVTGPSRSLAMKILSEKILDGYSMTRSHCRMCKMAMLRKDRSLGMDGRPAPPECVYCPVTTLRKLMTRGVCKRVMAAKLLSGLEVGATNGGKSLCNSCHSPSLRNQEGVTMECQVCLLLDAACLEIVREQGRGGVVQEARGCLECSSPEVYINGAMKCVVCDVLRAELGEEYCRRSEGNLALTQSSPSFGAHSVAPSVGAQSTTDASGARPIQSSASVAGAVSVVSEGPPALSTSTTMKSNDNQIDLTKIQELKEQLKLEIAKAKAYQQSLETPPKPGEIVRTPSFTSGFSQKSPELVKSPSIMSGDSPGLLSKIEDQLKEVLAEADKSQPSTDNSQAENNIPPENLAKLQEQLQAELDKAKESQAKLERSLNCNTAMANSKSRKTLRSELEKARQEQFALEQILQGTKNLEAADDADPSISHGNTTDILSAANRVTNQSYSISQQEVDPTGHIKEYINIPKPSYFFGNSGIPTEVIVYHMPEDVDCDPSVAAQSHHTKNLKRSERDAAGNHGVIDCCSGGGGENAHRHPDFDYDTIETDDDYTVDYTLNTMDDSRLEYLRVHRSKSSVKDYHSVDERRQEMESPRPTSSIGRCLFSCFGCGEEDDAYTMVSRRGIDMRQNAVPAHRPRGILRHPQARTSPGRGDSGHYYSPSMDESEGGRPRARQGVVPRQRKRLDRYGAEESDYGSIRRKDSDDDDSDVGSMVRAGDNGKGGDTHSRRNMRSPSPLFDFDSASGLGRSKGVPGPPRHPRPTPPASPRDSDYNSVTSDLSNISSTINRQLLAHANRVKIENQLRALTEEEETSDLADKYSVDRVDTGDLMSKAESAVSGRQARQY